MVWIILGNGFEPIEAVAPRDILSRGGVKVGYAGIGGTRVEGGQGITVEADCTVEQIDFDELDMIVLPGGMGGVRSILGSEKTLSLVRRAWEAGRFVAAICAGPTVLASLGITDGRRATCYPGMEDQMGGAVMADAPAVRDGKLITGRAAGAANDFGLALLSALRGEAAADKVARGIVYHR
jgi:4-methyl-5(b-hydroxyethyl)-thiazole monophosphate biosynthesis